MSYSLKVVLHPDADKNGLHKVRIQVLYNRMKAYVATDYKVKPTDFNNGEITGIPLKTKINANIRKLVHDTETRLIEALRNGPINKAAFQIIVRNPVFDGDFEVLYKLLKQQYSGKLSQGKMKHYEVMKNKILAFTPNFSVFNITTEWLLSFEKYLRESGINGNTLHTNISILRAMLYKIPSYEDAARKAFKKYKLPDYIQPIPEYITEDEMSKISQILQNISRQSYKVAGYYFLLSCYTGYRISDAKRFNINEMVRDGQIVLRAKKNKEIVSIPVFPRLQQVLDFVKDNAFDISEEKAREYVREVCSLAGITKYIKFHTARHSFAMLLMAKGFTQDEVAEMLGDSAEVAKIYARISNKQLSNKIIEKLG